ncbi:hypothetical protein L6164_015617 [Bauhinia variegata]|uniref:Uncharacterized protein n=1 Tax=Bauhinia variegata TaxID=167791 RepID=A0ACB9NLX7_BAUVA|nr:hypothetical protein L6164_015617 [Bauhinia variegata]
MPGSSASKRGGTMPAANLLLYFQRRVAQKNGQELDLHQANHGNNLWQGYLCQVDFIAVAQLFGYNNGEEWMVAYFLFNEK